MNKKINTAYLARVSMLSAAAFILTFIKIPLPIFPAFLELGISDIPAIIAACAMGPLAGFLVELIKNIIDFFIKNVALGIGQFANLLMASLYILPLGFFYHKLKGTKGFVIGAIIGICLSTIIGCLSNYYILIPAYMEVTVGDVKLDEFARTIPNIDNFKELIIFSIAPFNLIQYTVESILGYFIFMALKPFIARMNIKR